MLCLLNRATSPFLAVAIESYVKSLPVQICFLFQLFDSFHKRCEGLRLWVRHELGVHLNALFPFNSENNFTRYTYNNRIGRYLTDNNRVGAYSCIVSYCYGTQDFRSCTNNNIVTDCRVSLYFLPCCSPQCD